MNHQNVVPSARTEAAEARAWVDVSGLTLNPEVPQALRAGQLTQAMGDLCCFRVGEMRVQLEFSPQGPPLQDALSAFFRRKKGGL